MDAVREEQNAIMNAHANHVEEEMNNAFRLDQMNPKPWLRR